MGYDILSQENIEQLLPYKRKHFGKSEKMIFDTTGDDICRLSELLPNMDNEAVVDVVYELIYLIAKVEENGILSRECLWYKYDDIYYDIDQGGIRVAILPITDGFEDSECEEWYGDFENVVDNLLQRLSDKKSTKEAEKIKSVVEMMGDGVYSPHDALEEIDKLGCNVSTMLNETLTVERDTSLKLIYAGKNGEVVIAVDKDEVIIGRDKDKADVVISDDLSSAVSRKHCLITKTNNKYFVQDLNSSNYTLVNGVMIPPYEIMEIEDGDIMSIADLEFRVKINYIGG
jgi:hypothetical protein